MKAPDRLTIYGDGQYHSGPDTEGGGEEYIRKGAFPVEEIRDRIAALQQNVAVLDTLNRPELNGALCCMEASLQTFRRILSLLEGE